jgi:hypothetical protein
MNMEHTSKLFIIIKLDTLRKKTSDKQKMLGS